MTGATQMMREQSEVAHNLANADTVGFKAQLSAFQPLTVQGPGLPTRVNGVAHGLGVDLREGGQIETGRQLDVAVQGAGWIAVQSADGSEGYTRAGELRLTPDGLVTDGLMRLDDGGSAEADPTVTVKSGVLESSNVNPSQTLVQMIQLSRQYELQIRAIHSADENAQSASRLLQMS